MKNFLSFLKFDKSKRKAKTIVVRSGPFKGQRIYPFRKCTVPIDENSPFLVKKREDAIRSLTENPPPEFILRRMRGIE